MTSLHVIHWICITVLRCTIRHNYDEHDLVLKWQNILTPVIFLENTSKTDVGIISTSLYFSYSKHTLTWKYQPGLMRTRFDFSLKGYIVRCNDIVILENKLLRKTEYVKVWGLHIFCVIYIFYFFFLLGHEENYLVNG